ncbi:MAG: hypothetical protein ACP5RH_22490, partial [Leptodesmis sp.]|uniref:hypothetical protein n=1 Tax=Leptodesmis sp. TaxID=3100501 RepID=UPI003D0A3D63
MRHLKIPYPDSNEFALVYPVARDRLFPFDIATTQLREKWIKVGFNTDRVITDEWWLIEKIAGMVRADKDFPFDVNRLRG